MLVQLYLVNAIAIVLSTLEDEAVGSELFFFGSHLTLPWFTQNAAHQLDVESKHLGRLAEEFEYFGPFKNVSRLTWHVHNPDQLEEIVLEGARVPFSGGRLVNESDAVDILDAVRQALPSELERAAELLRQHQTFRILLQIQ